MARYGFRPGPRISTLSYDERSQDEDEDDNDDDSSSDFAVEDPASVAGNYGRRVGGGGRNTVFNDNASNNPKAALSNGQLKAGRTRRVGLRERKNGVVLSSSQTNANHGSKDAPPKDNPAKDNSASANDYPQHPAMLAENDGENYPLLKSLLMTNHTENNARENISNQRRYDEQSDDEAANVAEPNKKVSKVSNDPPFFGVNANSGLFYDVDNPSPPYPLPAPPFPPHLEDSVRLIPPFDHQRHSIPLSSPPPHPVLPSSPSSIRRPSSVATSPLEPADVTVGNAFGRRGSDVVDQAVGNGSSALVRRGSNVDIATTQGVASSKPSSSSESKPAAASKKASNKRTKKLGIDRRHAADSDPDVFIRTSKRLVHRHMKFPFAHLPPEVQSHIISSLTPKDRVNAALVCRSWRSLIAAPSIWGKVDLTTITIDDEMLTNYCKCLRRCKHLEAFEKYWDTISNLVDHVSLRVRPLIKELKFAFDFAHPLDGWDSIVLRLLNQLQNLTMLTSVDVTWDFTPFRPGCLTRYCCLVGQMRTAIHRHIRRIHLFRSFLDLLSKKARHLQYLRCPFDWSTINVFYLTRFSNLKHLTLEHYQTFQQLAQWKIQQLLDSLKLLRSLKISYISPSFTHTELYSLSSSSLRVLDISGCVGIFLRRLSTPNLESLLIARNPWQGRLKDSEEERARVPCLKEVIRGAPRLQNINSFYLNGENSADFLPQDQLTRDRSAACFERGGDCVKNEDSRGTLSVGSSSSSSASSFYNRRSTVGKRSRGVFDNLLLKVCPCSTHGRVWKSISTP